MEGTEDNLGLRTGALTSAQVRNFHMRGYLVLERLLSDRLLSALRAECDRLILAYRRVGLLEQGSGCILGENPTPGVVNVRCFGLWLLACSGMQGGGCNAA